MLRSVHAFILETSKSMSQFKNTASKSLVDRHPQNPILTADQMPFEAECVFNCGVTKHGAEVVMMVNVWNKEWVSIAKI